MNHNLCPRCRFSMRLWALDWRRSAHLGRGIDAGLLLRTAAGFRDECLHTDREKYDALVDKVNHLQRNGRYSRFDYPLLLALWGEIERIKNLHHGHAPVGRTFLAWRSRFDSGVPANLPPVRLERGTFNLQRATHAEAA